MGSKSTNTARGTCFPAPVSLKKVLKESSPPPMVLSLGIWPSGWIPCSKQYNSQQAFPIWTPAWPTWTEIHSRWNEGDQINQNWVHFREIFNSTYYIWNCILGAIFSFFTWTANYFEIWILMREPSYYCCSCLKLASVSKPWRKLIYFY